jgi:hypothetical protein
MRRRCRGAVITAVVPADMIWMIICFYRKRTFYCSRSVSAIGPFTPHSGHSVLGCLTCHIKQMLINIAGIRRCEGTDLF